MNRLRNVPALERSGRVIQTLLHSPWPLGISELARVLSLSKSTLHGLVHTLANLGLLEKENENGRNYQPSTLILSLWREALLKGNLARCARPLLTAFSERQALTTLAGVFINARVLVVEAVLAPGFSIAAYAGQWLPAWAGALGKLLLAALPPDRAEALAPRMAAQGPLGLEAYLAEVDQARQSQVALDREEYLKGVCALAAAVASGRPLEPLTAVWTVGLAPSLTGARMKDLTPEVRSLAEEIGRRLAHSEENGHDT
ncbi:MAG: IclR family transcriptional regulator C-terminal domain-containing protein [Thermodesulfobacteriota bacterium]